MSVAIERDSAARSVPPAQSVPTSWKLTLLIVAIGSARWIDTDAGIELAQTVTIPQLLLRILPTLAALALLSSAAVTRARGSAAPIGAPWFGFVAVIAVSSVGAVLFNRPIFAFWKNVEYLVPIVLGIALVRLPTNYVRYTFRFFVRAGFCVLLSAVALLVLSPDRVLITSATSIPRLTGFLPITGPGSLGLFAAAAILLYANKENWESRRRSLLLRLGVLSICYVGLLFAQSRTAFVALFALWALVAFSSATGSNGPRQLATLILGGLAGVVTLLVFPVLVTRDNADSFRTLSNRTLRWEESARLIGENPFWGSGIGVAARFQDINVTQSASLGFGQAHNAYLELALSVGVPATALVTFGLWRQLFRSRKMLSNSNTLEIRESTPAARVIAVWLIDGFANTFIITYNIVFMILVAALGVVGRELRQKNSNPRFMRSKT